MAPPKDIARSYPKRGMTADLGFRSEPKFCGDGSVELDGVDQCLKAELTAALGDSFTIMGWAKREFSGANSLDYIINAGSPSGAGNGISVSITNATSGILYFFDNATSVNSTNTVEYNEWFHFALTVSPGAGGVKLYKNGIDGTPSNTVAVDLSDVTFEVGRYLGVSHYFKGNLFDVRIYDETLTQDQIREVISNPAQTVPTGLTSADLIHRYLLETNSNDTGETGDNLTESNSPVYTVERAQLPRGLDLVRGAAYARCIMGRAVDFDGSTDFLDMGLGADKNYTTRSDRASFSFWFNLDQISNTQFLYQNRHNNVGGTNRPECETQVFTTASGLFFDGEGASVSVPAANLNLNQWHHFVGVADDSDGPVKVYLDGALYDTTGVAQAGANGNNFVIGARNNSPLQPFNGQLSNFKIFNVELTQDQARELYHNPEKVIPTGVSASNLRRHYPLCAYNDTSGMGGRYESDQGVEGVNGEYGGSPVMAFAQPVPCPQLGLQQSATRLHHPGASQGAAATITAPGTTVSLSAWILWDQARTSYPIALGTVTSSTDSFNIRINTSGQVTLYQNAEYLSGLTITEGGWNHIVFATRSDSPYWRCWLNNSEASSPAVANVTNITSTDCRLGMNSSSFGMGGIANDAAVWNTELGDSDVAALYNSGVQGMDVGTVQASNLKGWWKFDDLATLKDYSGNSANATVSGTFTAVQFPENASGSTLVGDISMKRKGASVLNCFDDPGAQRVRTEIPSGAGLQPSLTNGHTVTCWYRNQEQNTTSANNGTMVLGGNDGSNDRFILEAFNGNTFRGVYGAQTANSTATISDNEWHHYAMVLDVTTASPTIRLYLDGVAAGTQSGSVSTTFPEGKVAIGGLNTTTSRAGFNYGLKGPIACPRIYAFQLSENEIKQIYHADERLIKGLNNE